MHINKIQLTVAVCQAGYSAHQLKKAVVISNGKLADTSFQIINASDGSRVSDGRMECFTPPTWTRKETYYRIDFTAFNRVGDFQIKTNGVVSRKFTIAENIWTNYTGAAVTFYRAQRCGVDTNDALPAGFSNRPDPEALHSPCHCDDAKQESEVGANGDMTGGWHDAGDNNKYQSNSGWIAGALAIVFLRHPNADFDFDNNGIPDLLDEARFGAENLLKIQAAAGAGGGIYDTIDAANGAYYDWKYPASETAGIRGDSDDRAAHTRGVKGAVNALIYDATMKTAGSLAAVARAFDLRDPAFAAKCREGAIKAFHWALAHTANTGGNYSCSDQNIPKFWAAVELYRLTNDPGYKLWINSYVDGLAVISTAGTNYWGLQPLALAEFYPVAGSLQEKVVSLLGVAVDNWRESLVEPFGVQPINEATFGINEPNLSKAADAYRLYEITGDTKLKNAALSAVQWTLGVNPFDISWISGIGANFTTHLHTRLDADAPINARSTIKIPGAMVAGAVWSDPLNSGSVHPWYEDRPLAKDRFQQWRYNEYSISINYALLELIVAMAYKIRREETL